MKFELAIRDWLQQRIRGMVTLHLFGAALVFCFGVVGLMFTFLFVFFTLSIAVAWIWPHSWETRFWLSCGILFVLFVLGIFTDPRRMEEDLVEVGADRDIVQETVVRDMGHLLGHSVMSTNPRLEVKLYAYLICFGPRCMLQSIMLIDSARKMRHVDLDNCALVLAKLARADERIPFEELRQIVPRGSDPSEVFSQVRTVDGVLFLKKGTPGLSLTERLRKELRALKKKAKT
jgi:hypothetical protein